MDHFRTRRALKARLKEIRENMPPQTSEEAYAQLEKKRELDRQEKLKNKPADLPYITP